MEPLTFIEERYLADFATYTNSARFNLNALPKDVIKVLRYAGYIATGDGSIYVTRKGREYLRTFAPLSN